MIIFWSLFGIYLYGVICFAAALHRKGVWADEVSFWVVSVLWPIFVFFLIGIAAARLVVKSLFDED